MAYSNFTIKRFCSKFGFDFKISKLFDELDLEPSLTLQKTLEESQKLQLSSEKARSEAIIFPVLQEINRHNNYQIGLFSGENLNADFELELNGECDFILTSGYKPVLESPIFGLVEAKKEDIPSGYGQCAAQMLGAKILNEQDNKNIKEIFGCVTTGEIWQFMKLQDQTVWLDEKRYYIDRIERILGILQSIVDKYKN